MPSSPCLAAILLVTTLALITIAPAHGANEPVAATQPTLTDAEKAAGFQLLFDGKTSDGWRGYQKESFPDGWKVQDGALVRVGGGGDIATIAKFDNFELQLDWKISPGGNSGVIYHVSEAESAPWATGPECQILDNQRHPDGKDPKTSAGSCYALYAPSRDVTKPVGEWNHLRLIVDGKHIEHWLNGEKIVSYDLGSEDWNQRVADSKFKSMKLFGKMTTGQIVLQDHGDAVSYRNLKIRVLPSSPATQPAAAH